MSSVEKMSEEDVEAFRNLEEDSGQQVKSSRICLEEKGIAVVSETDFGGDSNTQKNFLNGGNANKKEWVDAEEGGEGEDDLDWPICVITSTSSSSLSGQSNGKEEPIPDREEGNDTTSNVAPPQTQTTEIKRKIETVDKVKGMEASQKESSSVKVTSLGSVNGGKASLPKTSSSKKKRAEVVSSSSSQRLPGAGVFNQCDICRTVFLKVEQLDKHIKEIHSETCGNVLKAPTPSTTDIASPEKVSSMSSPTHATPPPPRSPKPFICNLCGKKFLVKANWEDHRKVHHHGFKTPSTLQAPKALPLKGETSPVATTNNEETPPVVPKKQGPPYECPSCDRKFPLPFLLKRHMMVHNKPYQCSICMERFIIIEGLNLHKRLIHDVAGMSTFKCMVCGKKDFLLLSDMYTHRMENHSEVLYQGEKELPYGCGICKRPYQRKGDALVCAVLGHDPSTLKEAMFQHKCTECPMELQELGYHSIRALKKHWLKEHSEKPFPEEELLAENDYCFDAPLPKVMVDRRGAYDLKEKGLKEGETHLIVEFEKPTDEKGTCVIPVFACPDCQLTFINVESLRIHEQVHLQDEGPPSPSSSRSSKKPGRPKKFQVDEGGDTGAPTTPISLLPKAFIRGQHLIPKFKCVVCNQKFRKLKRLREHEQTHRSMDPDCPIFPKMPGRSGGRKPGVLKKKKVASALLPSIIRKRGRPKKVPFWVPSSVSKVGGNGKDDLASLPPVKVRPFHCQLCPAAFRLPKSLRMHELNVHNAPHRKPGRKKGMRDDRNNDRPVDVDPSNMLNGEVITKSATQVKQDREREDGKAPVPLAPGRIRVGRLEISTKFNKMIKQNAPIKICVTDENGGLAYHFQCPSCPKVFKDRRGIHLHILGHSLKTAEYRETEKKAKLLKAEESLEDNSMKKKSKEEGSLPSSISTSQRRTSERERRIPRKLSEYSVEDDDEEGTPVKNLAEPMDADFQPVADSPPESVITQDKKEGRDSYKKKSVSRHLLNEMEGGSSSSTSSSDVEKGERVAAERPAILFKKIGGEIVRKWPGRPKSTQISQRRPSGILEDQQLNTSRKKSRESEDEIYPSFEPPTCKICLKTFESVTELWYHGNEVHFRSTKVKYVPRVMPTVEKKEEKKEKVELQPSTSEAAINQVQQQAAGSTGNKGVSANGAPVLKKNPAVLALLQKKREQEGSAGKTVAASSPPKLEVPKNESENSVDSALVPKPQKTIDPGIPPAFEPKNGRPRKPKLLTSTMDSARTPQAGGVNSQNGASVSRIGQLRLPPKFRNKEVLKQEKPLIITETKENGETVTRYKCRRCPKTFRDMRGFPFHALCHLVKDHKKTHPADSEIQDLPVEKPEGEGGNVQKLSAEKGRVDRKVVVKQIVRKKVLPGLIPLGKAQKKRGRPRKWLVKNAVPLSSSSSSSLATSNGSVKLEGENEEVETSEPIPSTSRTSSVLLGGGIMFPDSENKPVSPQKMSPKAVPMLSPTSGEFRFKIVNGSDGSFILPIKKRRGRPSAKYLSYIRGSQKPVTEAATTSASAAEGKKSPSSPEGEMRKEDIKEQEEKENPVAITTKETYVLNEGPSAKTATVFSTTEKINLKPAPPVVTSLQLEDDHCAKKAKLAAILTKAREEDLVKKPIIVKNVDNSEMVSDEVTKQQKAETRNTTVKPEGISEQPISPSSVSITSDETPPPVLEGTLKRKRGRPKKTESGSNPTTSSTTTYFPPIKNELATCPSGLPFSKLPENSEIEVTKEEMEALKREIEKNDKEIMDSVVVSSAKSTLSHSTPVEGAASPPQKKKSLKSPKNSSISSSHLSDDNVTTPSATVIPAMTQSPSEEEDNSVVITPVVPLKRVRGRPKRPPPIDEPAEVVVTKVETLTPPTLQTTQSKLSGITRLSVPTPSSSSITEENLSPPAIKKRRGRPPKSLGSTPHISPPEEEAFPIPIPIRISSTLPSPDIVTHVTDTYVAKRARGRPRKSMPVLTRADRR